MNLLVLLKENRLPLLRYSATCICHLNVHNMLLLVHRPAGVSRRDLVNGYVQPHNAARGELDGICHEIQ